MQKINRECLADYVRALQVASNEELRREIWLLEEHIKYLASVQEDDLQHQKLLRVAKEERENRMVAQGYQ